MSADPHNCHGPQIFKDAIHYAMFTKVKTPKLVQRSAQLFGATIWILRYLFDELLLQGILDILWKGLHIRQAAAGQLEYEQVIPPRRPPQKNATCPGGDPLPDYRLPP